METTSTNLSSADIPPIARYGQVHTSRTPHTQLSIETGLTFVRFTSTCVMPAFLFTYNIIETLDRLKISVSAMSSSGMSAAMMVSASSDTLLNAAEALRDTASMETHSGLDLIHVASPDEADTRRIEAHIMDAVRDCPVSFISFGHDSGCFSIAVRPDDRAKIVERIGRTTV